MTRSFNAKIVCPACGCEHTQESDFERWMRNCRDLDSKNFGLVRYDCDILLHRYFLLNDKKNDRRIQCLMLIEVKAFGADMTPAQRDTINLFNQVLRNRRPNIHSSKKGLHALNHTPLCKVFSPMHKQMIQLKMFGAHLLQMSGNDPESSNQMIWDRRYKIDQDQLIQLLRFERDPDTLCPVDWRRRYSAFKNEKSLF